MRKRYPIRIFILFLAILILSGGLLGFKLSWNNSVRGFFEKLSPYTDLKIKIAELERENENLRVQLLMDEINPGPSFVVYASYPFNNRSEIAIAGGTDDNIKEGDIVTYGSNILVGRVRMVDKKTSVVSTIFDPGFETAVRIGDSSVDALLRGGNETILDLIPADAVIEEGAIVFTAGVDFPYGLEVGRIREVGQKGGGVFQSASLEPGFEIRTLKNVNIYR